MLGGRFLLVGFRAKIFVNRLFETAKEVGSQRIVVRVHALDFGHLGHDVLQLLHEDLVTVLDRRNLGRLHFQTLVNLFVARNNAAEPEDSGQDRLLRFLLLANIGLIDSRERRRRWRRRRIGLRDIVIILVERIYHWVLRRATVRRSSSLASKLRRQCEFDALESNRALLHGSSRLADNLHVVDPDDA